MPQHRIKWILNSCKWMGQRPELIFSFILASLRWFQAVRPDFYFILLTTSKELVFFSKILWCCFLQPGLPSSNIEIFHFWIKKFFFHLLSFWVFFCFRTILLRGPDNRHYVHNLILPDENSDENSDRSWSIRIAASIFPPKNPLLNEQLAATCIGNSCLEHMT